MSGLHGRDKDTERPDTWKKPRDRGDAHRGRRLCWKGCGKHSPERSEPPERIPNWRHRAAGRCPRQPRTGGGADSAGVLAGRCAAPHRELPRGPGAQSGGSALSEPLPGRAAPPDPGPTAVSPRPPCLPAASRHQRYPRASISTSRPRSAHRPRLPRPSGPRWQRGPPALRQRLGKVGRDVRRRRVPRLPRKDYNSHRAPRQALRMLGAGHRE